MMQIMFTEYSPKRFDLEHADMAPFPCNRGPLPTETKRQIYQEHCRGDSAAALAQRFCRTRTSIYGVIKEIPRSADHGTASGLHGQRDLEASRGRGGRNQRAGPTDPVQGDEQIENGCRRGPHRVSVLSGGKEL